MYNTNNNYQSAFQNQNVYRGGSFVQSPVYNSVGTGVQSYATPAYVQAVPTSPQAIFQPGFAGTNVQQVRQDIAREGGFNYTAGVNPALGQTTQQVYPTSVGGSTVLFPSTNVQAVFQPGFAGTNVQQVRQDIANEGGFNYTAGYTPAQQFGVQQSFVPTATNVGIQSVFQPSFAGTNVQQVRQDIAREGGLPNYSTQNVFASQPFASQVFNNQSFIPQVVTTSPQAIFQPGFAGTNVQQVRQDIAREGGLNPLPYGSQVGFNQQPVTAFYR